MRIVAPLNGRNGTSNFGMAVFAHDRLRGRVWTAKPASEIRTCRMIHTHTFLSNL